jgi:crotonobetaine/carnitine-CoA ligase
MIALDDNTTIGDAFARAAQAYGPRPFLAVPAGAHRAYHRHGVEIDFASAAHEVRRLTVIYRAAGYGHGHRVAMLLDNRPEHFLHKLALNALGVSAVPINPDYRANEIAYLLENAEVDFALVAGERSEQLDAGMRASSHAAPVTIFDELSGLRAPKRAARNDPVSAASEASVLYTSGTTGRPKGCMLSHGYELASGAWYATRGAQASFRPEGDRIYNPLPVYHCNSSVVSFYGALLNGSCQIQPDRFHPNRWWSEVKETGAMLHDKARDITAEMLFDHCHARLAYFKAPGWIYFTDTLPTTGTQKIQKHQIFPAGTDPRALPGMFDLRERKKRDTSRAGG